MNPLKTPHELLLEESGLSQPTPGMVKTAKQMLVEESGVLPRFAKGKQVKQLTPDEMQAEMIVGNHTPPKMKVASDVSVKLVKVSDQDVKKLVDDVFKSDKIPNAALIRKLLGPLILGLSEMPLPDIKNK
jgi:hypothetical protein